MHLSPSSPQQLCPGQGLIVDTFMNQTDDGIGRFLRFRQEVVPVLLQAEGLEPPLERICSDIARLRRALNRVVNEHHEEAARFIRALEEDRRYITGTHRVEPAS